MIHGLELFFLLNKAKDLACDIYIISDDNIIDTWKIHNLDNSKLVLKYCANEQEKNLEFIKGKKVKISFEYGGQIVEADTAFIVKQDNYFVFSMPTQLHTSSIEKNSQKQKLEICANDDIFTEFNFVLMPKNIVVMSEEKKLQSIELMQNLTLRLFIRNRLLKMEAVLKSKYDNANESKLVFEITKIIPEDYRFLFEYCTNTILTD